MATEIGWTDLTNVSATSVMGLVLSDRLLSTQKMEDYIAENIGNKQFHELNIPFACVATDLRTGEKIIFREGQVSQAVRASANIPGLFTPVEYRHRLLVDGGLVNNVPVDLAKSMGADIIITVNLESDFTKTNINNVMLVFNQAIAIQSSLLSREQLKLSDIVITPQTKDVAFYELWRSKECIEAGIVACRKSIPEIKQKLIGQTYKWILKKRKK